MKPGESAFAVHCLASRGAMGDAIGGGFGNEFGVSLIDVLKLLVGHFVPHRLVLQC
jgi:hypothetical protein